MRYIDDETGRTIESDQELSEAELMEAFGQKQEVAPTPVSTPQSESQARYDKYKNFLMSGADVANRPGPAQRFAEEERKAVQEREQQKAMANRIFPALQKSLKPGAIELASGLLQALNTADQYLTPTGAVRNLAKKTTEQTFGEKIEQPQPLQTWSLELDTLARSLDPHYEQGTPEYYAYAAGVNLIQNVPPIVLGTLTGSEWLALLMMGASAAGQKKNELLQRGYDDETASAIAGMYGAAEVIGEKVSIGHVIKGSMLSRMILGTLYDIPGELLTEVLQAGIDKGVLKEEDAFTWNRFFDTAIITGLTGPFLGGASGLISKAQQRALRKTTITKDDTGGLKIETPPDKSQQWFGGIGQEKTGTPETLIPEQPDTNISFASEGSTNVATDNTGNEVGRYENGNLTISPDFQGDRFALAKRLLGETLSDAQNTPLNQSLDSEGINIRTPQKDEMLGNLEGDLQPQITLEMVQQHYPNQEVTDLGNGRFEVTTEGGKTVHIDTVKKIVIDVEQAKKDYPDIDFSNTDNLVAEGKSVVINGEGFITLVEAGTELGHETYHIAERMALSKREIAAVSKRIADSEERAKAYQEYKNADDAKRKKLQRTALGRAWQKILDWASRMRQMIHPTAQGVFADVAQGRVWEQTNEMTGTGDLQYNIDMSRNQGTGESTKTNPEVKPEGGKEPKWHNLNSEDRKAYYNPNKIRSQGNYQIWDFDENKWWTFQDKTNEDAFREKYPVAFLSKNPAGTERVWYRFGKPPASNRSYDYANQKGEAGVSVYVTPEGSGGSVFFADRKIYSGLGRQIGWGTDGEPLIIPTSKWSEINPNPTRSPGEGEQYSINTESEAFKKWFGDSKVVDENGKPLVVYHGTLNNFEAFSDKKSVNTDRSITRKFGFFFTSDLTEAERYSHWNGATKGKLLETYLSIQNPYPMPYSEFDTFAMYEFNKMKESGYRFSDDDERKWKKEATTAVNKKKVELQQQGYDGIFVKTNSGTITEYVVFSPSQIKSVYNRGTWSTEDDRILYSIKEKDDIIKNATEQATGETGVQSQGTEESADKNEISSAYNQARTQEVEQLKQSQSFEDFESMLFGDTSMEDPLRRGMSLEELERFRRNPNPDKIKSVISELSNQLRQAKSLYNNYFNAGKKIEASRQEAVIKGLKKEIRELRSLQSELFKAGKRFGKAEAQESIDTLESQIDELNRSIAESRVIANDMFRAGRKIGAVEQLEKVREKTEMLRERTKLVQEGKKLREFLRKTQKKIPKKLSIDPEYRNAVLSAIDLNADAVEAFILKQLEEGDIFMLAEDQLEMLREANRERPSIDDLRNRVSIVKQLMYQGLKKRQIQIANEKFERKALVQDINDEIRSAWDVPEISFTEQLATEYYTTSQKDKPTVRNKLKNVMHQAGGILRKAEYIINNLTGYKENSLLKQATFDKTVEAERVEIKLGKQTATMVRNAFGLIRDEYISGKLNETISIDGIQGGKIERSKAIAVALNSGNEGNRKALREGTNGDLTDENIEKIVNALTPAEKQFVEAIWNILEWQRPHLQKAYKSMTGEDMQLVDGRYYPLKWDKRYATKISQAQEEQNLFRLYGSIASVARGMTMARKGGAMTVDLDFMNVLQHIDDVNHFVAYGETVRDINRIISNMRVKSAVNDAIGTPYNDALKKWLKNLANPQYESMPGWDRVMGKLRNNAATAILGYGLSTALMQPLAVTQTVNRLGVIPTLKGFSEFYTHWGELSQFINENSPFMSLRTHNFDATLKEIMDGDKDAVWNKGKATDKVKQSFFGLIGMLDKIVTMPTWYSAYQVEMDKSGSHEKAVNYADMIVRQSQSSGMPKDLAEVQRGNNTRKAFVMFYSYFSTTYNEMVRSVDLVKHKEIGMLGLMRSFFWIMAVPAILQAIIKNRGWWDSDEPEEEIPWDVAKELVGYGSAMIPVVGSAINSIMENYEYRPAPAMSIVKEATTVARTIPKLVSGDTSYHGKGIHPAMRSGGMLAGYLFGLPSRQAMRIADEAWNAYEEEEISWENIYGLVYREQKK